MRRSVSIIAAIVLAFSTFTVLIDRDGVAFAQYQDGAPTISTVAKVRDVLSEDGEWSTATQNEPATAQTYIIEILNGEAAERISREEKEAEEKAEKQSETESKALARELVKNGRYKDLIGYDCRYVKWYDETGDSYYKELATRYPSIDEFWFDSDGKYHYEYDPDYDHIDYSDLYYHINHDTFAIVDTLTYRGLTPGTRYIVEASLVYASPADPDDADSGGTPGNEAPIKTIRAEFVAAEGGSGDVELDFGELKLDDDIYVIFTTVRSEDGIQVIEHKDPNDTLETIYIENVNTDWTVKDSRAKFHGVGDGKIDLPGDDSPDTADGANATVPALLMMLAATCVASATSRPRTSNRKGRYDG